MSDFDCDPLFSRLYLEMLEQMTAYSARRLGDIGLAEDVEKVRTVPLDELAHPPAAPVERRLYLSDYLPPDTSRADRRIVRLRLEGYRYQEIAEKMGMTEIQCRVRLFRLREKLKKFEETLGNL